MSILIYGAGAVALMVGVAMVGFGIPINEFSFGNTLIISGTTAAVGGLVVIALGAAVAHLQRIGDSLATRAPARPSRPFDMAEPGAAARGPAASSRVPFPPKPKSEPKIREPLPPEMRTEMSAMPTSADAPTRDRQVASFAPTLPNPDEPPVTVDDEVSLSPRQPNAPSAPASGGFGEPVRGRPPFGSDDSEMDEAPDERPARDIGWRSSPMGAPPPARPPQHSSYFDAMWPADAKPASAKPVEAKADEVKSVEDKSADEMPLAAEPAEAAPAQSPPARDSESEPVFDWPRRETASAAAKPADQAAAKFVDQDEEEFAQPPPDEPRTVAILKSGVVDGMGYTLYVDGSIEAELPQGTLRFASINELRSHLEKAS